jgi:hypothetical protein
MLMTDHVIFRYEPGHRPEITFRGIPSGCAGGANTMAEARASYRACLSARLHVDRRALPPVVEHIEGVVGGMWVRTKVGAVHRDKSSDRMLLQILLAEQTGLRDEVARLSSAGAEPDALLVAHSDDNGSVNWGMLCGPESPAGQDVSSASDDDGLRAMAVADFTQTCPGGRVVQRRPAAGIAS